MSPEGFLRKLGFWPPEGNADAVREAANAWRKLAADVRQLHTDLSADVTKVGQDWGGPGREAFDTMWEDLAKNLNESPAQLEEFAGELDKLAGRIDDMHHLWEASLVIAGGGIAAGLITMGGSTAAAAAEVTTAAFAVNTARAAAFAALRAALLRLLGAVSLDFAIGFGTDIATQVAKNKIVDHEANPFSHINYQHAAGAGLITVGLNGVPMPYKGGKFMGGSGVRQAGGRFMLQGASAFTGDALFQLVTTGKIDVSEAALMGITGPASAHVAMKTAAVSRGFRNKRLSPDPIDLVTGEVVLQQVDVELPGTLPLRLARTHGSNYAAGGWFGRSWASTIDIRIDEHDEGNLLGLVWEDGSILTYPAPTNEQPTQLPKQGQPWPLTRDETGQSYVVRDETAGLTYHFAPRDPTTYTTTEGLTRILPLAQIRDRHGNTIKIIRFPDGAPAEVAHSGGYRVLIDTEGSRVVALRLHQDDQREPVVLKRFDYDDIGELATVFNATGAATRFEYDGHLRLERWIDSNANTYSYIYDELGRAVKGRGINGIFDTHLAYDIENLRTVITDSVGREHIVEYDQSGRVTRRVEPGGRVTLTAFDQWDQLLTSTDPLGRVTTYTYQGPDLLRVEQPGGRVTSYTYTPDHQPTSFTDPAGRTWRMLYDEHANPARITAPAGATTTFEHRPDGAITAVTDPLGRTTRVECSPTGLPLRVTNPLGHATNLDYDPAGRLVSHSDPMGAETTFTYTLDGKLATRTRPDGSSESWDYDGELNLTGFTDPYGRLTQYQYGPFDRLLAITRPDQSRIEYTYTTEGDPLTVTDALGRAWSYVYDPTSGDLTAETDVNGVTTRYETDTAGRLIKRTNAENQTVAYTWDDSDQIATQTIDDETTTFTYDPTGLLLSAESPSMTLTRTHDVVGRVTSESWDQHTISFTYDPAGQRIGRITPAGSHSTWNYNEAGQAVGLNTGGHLLEFAYDPAGRETTRTLGELQHQQTWNPIGNLLTQTLNHNAPIASGVQTPARQLSHREYTYEGPDRLIGILDQGHGRRVFTLDALDRITQITTPAGSETYAYNPAGSITQASWPEHTDNPTRDLEGTRTRRAGPVTYQYDHAGRVVMRRHKRLSTKAAVWHYKWDAQDRLTQVRTPAGATWTYTYDHLGRRITKTTSSPDGSSAIHEHAWWDGPTLTETRTTRASNTSDGTGEATASGSATSWEWHPDTNHPLTQQVRPTSEPEVGDRDQDWYDQQFQLITTDLIGAPTQLTTPDAQTTHLQPANTWGLAASTATALRLPGQQHDPETGLHYNHHRYYDPTTATYITPDPLGLTATTNPHTYVPNPTTWTDTAGLVAGCPKAAKTVPKQIDAAWGGLNTYRHGGSMTAIEHVNYRHAYGSGFTDVSHFAEGTTIRQIGGYVDDAVRYGTVTPNGPNGFKIVHDTGNVVGTNPAGQTVTGIQVYVLNGKIMTAFPVGAP